MLAGAAYSAWRGKPQELHVKSLANLDEFQRYVMEAERALKEQRQLELALIRSGSIFHVRGHCFPCHAWRRFPVTWAYSSVVDGKLQPNWREQLSCPYCNLNNRLRASIHLLELMSGLSSSSHIYMTEQRTPLFRWIRARFPNTIGSEFLGASVRPGELNGAGIRNEDVTRLTFASAQFDGVLSFEVFEHVQDFRQAFSECARVLRPGGHMLFSAPFDAGSPTNLIRARVSSDGAIEHLLPPEYHGDPLNEGGALAFQSFGWEMLEQVREAGFDRVSALLYHSSDFGYLGRNQIQFLAVK
jgi:Methyltransferase domain